MTIAAPQLWHLAIDASLQNTLLTQELFTWRLLVTVCILAAVTTELVVLSSRTARKLDEARAKLRRKRPFAADKEREREGGDEFGPEMPEIPKTAESREQLLAERELYRREIRAERSRGLGWLAVCTLVAIWCTGILFKDNALQP